MNRRSFFTKLALGLAAAPAVAKVLSEEPPPQSKRHLWVIDWEDIEIGVPYKVDATSYQHVVRDYETSLTQARPTYLTPEYLAALEEIERKNPGALYQATENFSKP